MFGILRNQYTKLIRRQKKSPEAINNFIDVCNQQPDHEQSETRNAVQYAVSELDERYRLPLLLVAMESMSVDEAATVLDLPRGTVLSRLHRGRQKLKEILIREFDQFET